MTMPTSTLDQWVTTCDQALRAVFGFQHAQNAYPAATPNEFPLTPAERQHAAALMRINHVGEVCAQALYNAQAAATQDPALRTHFLKGAKEEGDHLAWTRQRLTELGGRTSLLNPLWYAGAYTFGRIAGRFGDPTSLGFVVETERQVEAHLDGHLSSLPENDTVSRAIVAKMKADEVAHADQALDKGAIELPKPVKSLMRAAAKVMTTVAYKI